MHLNPCLFEDVEICVCLNENVGGFVLIYGGHLLPLLRCLLDTELTYVMDRVSICIDPVIGSNAFSVLMLGAKFLLDCAKSFVF